MIFGLTACLSEPLRLRKLNIEKGETTFFCSSTIIRSALDRQDEFPTKPDTHIWKEPVWDPGNSYWSEKMPTIEPGIVETLDRKSNVCLVPK